MPNARELLEHRGLPNQWAVPAAFNTNCVPGATVLTGSCTFQPSTGLRRQAGSNISAWEVDNYGSLNWGFKSSTSRARAVRGGTQ